MFDQLSERLQKVFRNLRGFGKLTEKNVREALGEIRVALLEADVHYEVVKNLIERVQAQALGQEVLSSITPGQQVIKVVHEELVRVLGDGAAEVATAGPGEVLRLMLVGLQGSGKTTTAGKLAALLRKKERRPLLVACDTQRPAAREQLRLLAGQLSLPYFTISDEKNPVRIVAEAIQKVREFDVNCLICDTAGRLHVDEALMAEMRQIKETLQPQELLLVADAMTGQDAVKSAKAFDEAVGLTGVILTKLDGDARGGAALSIRAVTGRPIKFVGVGEKLTELEPFFPERIASRILGKGDVVSLVEKAQETVSRDEAEKLQEKLQKAEFDLEDFLAQMRQMRKMGSLKDLIGMIPGMEQLKNIDVDEGELKRTEAIILSMTPQERRNPGILNFKRRQRVASGSGTTVQEIGSLLKRFEMARKMMKQMGKMGKMPLGSPGRFFS